VVNVVSPTAREQKGYLVQIRDEEIRRESTSGGAFTGIAQYVIAQGGVVFGAAYDTDFQVVHTFVEQVSELRLFRNSKYVQSKMGDSFWQVKKFLSEGRLVCFSGTPCQVEGLFHYLGGEHENLILVDIVCHAVPSPKVWNKYLEVQKNKFGSISNIRFRDKYWGYKYSNLAILNMGGVKFATMQALIQTLCYVLFSVTSVTALPVINVVLRKDTGFRILPFGIVLSPKSYLLP
jgi:hypothetical protein